MILICHSSDPDATQTESPDNSSLRMVHAAAIGCCCSRLLLLLSAASGCCRWWCQHCCCHKLGLKGYSLYFLKQSFICCTVSSQSILPW